MDELNQEDTGLTELSSEVDDTAPVEEVDTGSPFEKAIRVELSEEDRATLFKEIEEEMQEIKKEYDDADYYNRIQKAEDEYLLKKEYTDYPIPDGSNRKVAFLLMFTDILTGKAVRQTEEPDPMFLMESSRFGMEIDVDEKAANESRLDFIMRKDVKIGELLRQVYSRSYYQGSAIIKTPFVHNPSYRTTNKEYSKENELEYIKYAGDKILDQDSEESKAFNEFDNGGKTKAIHDEVSHIEHGPRSYRVFLDRFYARLSITDFNAQKLISEQMKLNWIDVSGNFDSKFYHEDALEEFKNKHPKYTEEQFEDIHEAILQSDCLSKGTIRKYHIVFDSESKQILRCVYYEYKHNKCNYTNICARPRDDQWLGYMASERLEDTISAANAFLNAEINEYTIAHQMTIATDSQQDFSRQEVSDTNIGVIKLDKGSSFNQIQWGRAPVDRLPFSEYLKSFASLLEGIDASLSSGGETPNDPRAPAAKTAMKLQQSTMRMEDLISSMQIGINEVALQCASIIDQFPDETDNADEANSGDIKRELAKDNIMYVCHGSKIAFNKAADLQVTMGTIDFMSKFSPELLQDPEIKKILFECVINATEGSIRSYKKRLIKPFDMIIKAKNETLARTKALEEKAISMGIDPTEVMRNIGKPPAQPMVQGAQQAPGLPQAQSSVGGGM